MLRILSDFVLVKAGSIKCVCARIQASLKHTSLNTFAVQVFRANTHAHSVCVCVQCFPARVSLNMPPVCFISGYEAWIPRDHGWQCVSRIAALGELRVVCVHCVHMCLCHVCHVCVMCLCAHACNQEERI